MSLLSGLLLVVAFPSMDFGFLGWVALVPLLVAVHDQSPRRAFGLGYLAGAVAYLGVVSWMRVFGLPAWILLAAYLSLYVGAFAALYRWLANSRPVWIRLWLVPVTWTALEYVRSIGTLGFPWALLGLTQHGSLPIIQLAPLAGVFGISFALALASAAIATVITTRRIAPVIIPALCIAALVGWGVPRAGRHPVGRLAVAAVQPNVPPRVKFDPLSAPQHMDALRRLVGDAGRSGAELIVLPETAIPYNLFGERGVLREVGWWAHNARATLIASSLENGVSNIAVAVAPSGDAVSRYDKVHLVAFGEYGIRPGTRYDPLWTPLGRVGVAICFESIFPDVTRALIANGAEMLAVITNDGWFDGTAGPAQHAAQTVFRAVETDRWVVRAANTGISMLVDPAGRIRMTAPPQQEAVLVDRIAPSRSLTFYVRWGDLFAQVLLAILLIAALPNVKATVTADWRNPAFQHTAAGLVLPFIALWFLLRAGASPWVWSLVVLGFVAVLGQLRPWPAWGFHRSRFVTTALAGGAVVAGLWGILVLALRAYDLPTGLIPPGEGWILATLRQVVVAAAAEAWLRGMVFTSLTEWKGWPAALIVTTALGVMLQAGLPAEAMAWSMVTGAAFGGIRARTGNAAGLVLPHALGNILFSIVTTVR